MGMIDLFKGFHSEAIQQEFPPGARVLFDTLVYKFNEAYWADELVLSERDLVHLTGLKKTTLHEAKHFLTSRHLVERKVFKKKEAYSLGERMKKLLSDQQATGKRPIGDRSEAMPIKRVREDVKTPDNDSMDGASACELDEVVDYWERDLRGGVLSFEHQSQIAVYLSQKGAPWLRAIMAEASAANGNNRGLTPKFLFAVIARKLAAEKPAPKSGSKRSAAELTAATLQKATNGASSESLTHAASQWT